MTKIRTAFRTTLGLAVLLLAAACNSAPEGTSQAATGTASGCCEAGKDAKGSCCEAGKEAAKSCCDAAGGQKEAATPTKN